MAHLLPGASFSLAPGVILCDSELRDVDGQTYPLTQVGVEICRLAARPVAFDVLTRGLSEYFDVEAERMADDVRHFVLDLHGRGLVAVQQSFLREALARLTLLVPRLRARDLGSTMDLGRMRLFRRYPPTVGGVVRTAIEAYQGVSWAGLVVALVAVLVALVASPNLVTLYLGVRALGVAVPLFFVVFVVSVLVHELGHLLLIRLTHTVAYSTYAASGIAGLSYTQPSRAKRALIVTAGPIASILFLLVVAASIAWSAPAFWALTTFDGFRLSALAGTFAFAGSQLFAFTPLTADGRVLIRAIRGS